MQDDDGVSADSEITTRKPITITCAIKTIKRKQLHNMNNTQLLPWVLDEKSFDIAKLRHPNIVSYIRFYSDDARIYLLMEYVNGGKKLDSFLMVCVLFEEEDSKDAFIVLLLVTRNKTIARDFNLLIWIYFTSSSERCQSKTYITVMSFKFETNPLFFVFTDTRRQYQYLSMDLQSNRSRPPIHCFHTFSAQVRYQICK